MNGLRSRAGSFARRRRFFKKEARAVLCFRSNWIAVLLVLFALLFFPAAAVFFSGCLYYALTLSAAENAVLTVSEPILYTVFAVLLFLLLSPLYPGLLSYLYDLYRGYRKDGARIPPSEVFCFYASFDGVVRGWLLAFLRLLSFLLIPAVLYIPWKADALLRPALLSLGNTFICGMAADILEYGVGFCLLLLAFCGQISVSLFMFYTVSRPEMPLSSHIGQSRSLTFRCAPEGLLLGLSFLPWFLLSVLSAGILFFLYVLPYYLFTVISFCARVTSEGDR